MVKQGEGAIFFTGASASVKGYAQSAPFAMGKFALRGLAQSMARELTIQVRPVQGREMEADLRITADLARRTRGIEAVRVFDRAESEKLLEPWLGAGLDLGELPVPRLIQTRDVAFLRRPVA